MNYDQRTFVSTLIESELREFCARGPRASTEQVRGAEQWITARLGEMGYSVILQLVPTNNRDGGIDTRFNIIARHKAVKDGAKRVLFTAHYDTVAGTSGADDNASGVISILNIARMFKINNSPVPAEFVFFTNEEPPHFTTNSMGSKLYFSKWHFKDYVQAFNFDCVGYFIEKENELSPEISLYGKASGLSGIEDIPNDTAGFIVSAGDLQSQRILSSWNKATEMLPVKVPAGGYLGFLSDQRWIFDSFPVVQITDMALTRSDLYHTSRDTPDTLNYDRMSDVALGVYEAVHTEWSTNG